MDLRNFSKAGGAFQYTPPRCYELAGQKFVLQMDDGYDILLNFLSRDTLEWNYVNKEPSAPQTDKYECLKGDDLIYLVSWNLAGVDFKKRQNFTFVIDLEQYLVTHLIASVGRNPRWPYLVDTDFVFGAIQQEGVEYKHYPRHGFSNDMVGNVVQWQYSPDMATVHCYYAPNWYRITYPKSAQASQEAAATTDNFNSLVSALPSSDDPSHLVKIKDGVYLVSCTEQNMEKILGAKAMFRSDTLCFLDNYNHVYDVGRGFGTMTMTNPETQEETDSDVFVMIGAYGKIQDPELYKDVLEAKNPYLV
ncbi:MAG: MoaF N-terminal domain-containing protein [Oscillospiraceae bacterium]|jgi:hypothetical protein|nr:MoaF N-terminal domain-containing protein [Oscillospiraceae bacterium]